MASAFTVIATLLFCMIRSARKRDPEVDRLLDEMADDEKKPRAVKPTGEAKKGDWEKDGDWWKDEKNH